MDVADEAQIDIFRRWVAQPPAVRAARLARYQAAAAAIARRCRDRPMSEAMCGFCELLLPRTAFNPCEWNKGRARVRYCAMCRSFTGRRQRLQRAVA